MRASRVVWLVLFSLAFPVTSSSQTVSALDVLAACRSTVADSGKLRFFCRDLRIPTRVRDLTAMEQSVWKDSVPAAADVKKAATHALSFKGLGEQVRADLQRVRFDTDSAVIVDPDELRRLEATARRIAATPSLHVALTGFASSSGDSAGNRRLAARRAEYVRAVLLENGVLPSQLDETRSEGDLRAMAIASGRRVESDAFRRVDLRVYPAGSASALTVSGVAPRTAGTRIGAEALLYGLTDYLISQALEEVQASVMKSTLGRLCEPGSSAYLFINASCQSLLSNGRVEFVPSLNRLRAAIRQDLARLPVNLVAGAPVNDPQKCSLAIGAGIFVSLSEGEPPLEALAGTVQGRAGNCVGALGDHAREMLEYVNQMQTTASDMEALGKGAHFNSDSIANYLIKAAAVNAGYNARAETVQRIARLVNAYEVTLSAWEAVTVELRAARADSLAGGSRARLAALIGSATPMILEVLPPAGAARAASLRLIVALVRDGTTSMATGQYADALSSLLQAADLAGIRQALPFSALAFAADIAQAGSPQEVTQAFTRYADAKRGVARKRAVNAWYGAINGYMGVAGGRERVAGEYAGLTSLYGPVGFEFGRSTQAAGRGAGAIRSVGLLLYPIDLGSLAAIRMGGADTVSQTPPPTFAAVWAPGALLRFGFGEGRFVAGLGAEYLPVARRLKGDGDWLSGIRQIVTLAVDVPLFP